MKKLEGEYLTIERRNDVICPVCGEFAVEGLMFHDKVSGGGFEVCINCLRKVMPPNTIYKRQVSKSGGD